MTAAYDEIGRDYGEYRRADPRLAAAIWAALGNARSVINVGAGSGSYEPADRDVLAVEPSAVMIAQRPPGAARALQATAESLPLYDDSFDAAMAVLTLQHWTDVEQGLAELSRVARQRIVLVTMDVEQLGEHWLIRDYIPETLATQAVAFPSISSLERALPGASVSVLAVPRDCTDRFMAALWARPEDYFDPRLRNATSAWHELPDQIVERALGTLRCDLDSGRWDERYGHLRRMPELDVGLRIVCAELGAG
ncbi:MAG TPA: class I SAM-dependent methyltransferase [Solirubrobacteraceae bacterium]